MRSGSVVVVLLACCSCTVFKDSAKAVCHAEQQVSAALTQSMAWLGAPGTVVGAVLTAGLSGVCAVFRAPMDVLHECGKKVPFVPLTKDPEENQK